MQKFIFASQNNNYIIKLSTESCEKSYEDTKGLIRSRKSKDRQHNGQTKKYNDLQNTENKRLSNTNPTKTLG